MWLFIIYFGLIVIFLGGVCWGESIVFNVMLGLCVFGLFIVFSFVVLLVVFIYWFG